MRRILGSIPVFLVLTALLALAGCSDADTNPLQPDAAEKAAGKKQSGAVVAANRGSGSISVLDGRSGELRGTYMLPYGEGDAMPEPMYVNGVAAMQRVFVGDRGNDRVVVFDARSFEVVGMVPAGRGVFHQWADRQGKQLWVNNDIDNTITVIDTKRLDVIATIDLPGDLVEMGGKPHDVVVDHFGRYAYVTMLGFGGDHDYLLQYDARTFAEMNRQMVGKDPHLALGKNTSLYVPAQGSDEVRVFDPASLELLEVIAAPGAHGAAVSPNGRWFYATNLPGGGAHALLTIDTRSNALAGDAVGTPYAVPHNVALSADGRMLFVTHSGGSADKVTFYRIDPRTGQPSYDGEATVGTNPFGLGFVY